jgi:coenzyme F420 hydrogenase subunit beta
MVKKSSVWGRRLALQLFQLPVTRFEGLFLWRYWKTLSVEDKLRSILGTIRRIWTRQLFKPLRPGFLASVPVKPPLMASSYKSVANIR